MYLAKAFYNLQDWWYRRSFIRNGAYLFGFILYIALLLLFANLEYFHAALTDQIPADQTTTIAEADTTHPFIKLHARFLMMVSNWGLLFFLFIDLFIANRIQNARTITAMNILGVIAIMVAYGCAAGCIVTPSIREELGLFASPIATIIASIFLAIVLCFLKYESIKPTKSK